MHARHSGSVKVSVVQAPLSKQAMPTHRASWNASLASPGSRPWAHSWAHWRSRLSAHGSTQSSSSPQVGGGSGATVVLLLSVVSTPVVVVVVVVVVSSPVVGGAVVELLVLLVLLVSGCSMPPRSSLLQARKVQMATTGSDARGDMESRR